MNNAGSNSAFGTNEQTPVVRILVLHWKGLEKTQNCLESLRTLQYRNYRVLVVDNGSDNHDGDQLKASFPEIDVLRLETNRGFSGGCNAGMEYCIQEGCSYIWLLNNDTLVSQTHSVFLSNADCAIRKPERSEHRLYGETNMVARWWHTQELVKSTSSAPRLIYFLQKEMKTAPVNGSPARISFCEPRH